MAWKLPHVAGMDKKYVKSNDNESAFIFFFFSGIHMHHREVPRQGVEWEPQQPAYTTATATPDP